MNKKRGEVEIQFNWILILIAGALIFVFFFYVIKWAMKSSAESSSQEISVNLDTILTGATVTQKTETKITLPIKKLEFPDVNRIRIDDSRTYPINNKVLFVPNRIDGPEIITWSLGWDMPFRVTNFLFVSSPNIRYVVVGKPSEYSDLESLFTRDAKNFYIKFYDCTAMSSLTNENNPKVRLIFFDSASTPCPYNSQWGRNLKLKAEDLSFLKVDIDQKKLFFYKADHGAPLKQIGDPSGYPYFGESTSLIAGIFSENPEIYKTNMEKAIVRLNNITSIYQERSRFIAQNEAKLQCAAAHSTDTISSGGPYPGSVFKFSLPDEIINFRNALESKNYEAQKFSCPLIY